MSIYPKEYSLENFDKMYKSEEVKKGNIIKVDMGGKKCIGIFKGLIPGFMESFWRLFIHPQFWVQGKTVTDAKNDSPDYSVISQLKRVTVLASDLSTWDRNEVLFDTDSPAKRRASNEEISLITSLSRTSSGVSLAPISPIGIDELRNSQDNWRVSPRSALNGGSAINASDLSSKPSEKLLPMASIRK